MEKYYLINSPDRLFSDLLFGNYRIFGTFQPAGKSPTGDCVKIPEKWTAPTEFIMNLRSANSGVDKHDSQSEYPVLWRNSSIGVLILILALFCSCLKTAPSTSDLIVRLEPAKLSAYYSQTIPLALVDEDPNIVYSLIKFERVYTSQDELLSEFNQALASHQVSQGVIDRTGNFTFQDIPPGHYWVITSEPLVMEDERFVWSHPVKIGGGDRSHEVVLQRSNAAMILGSGNIIF